MDSKGSTAAAEVRSSDRDVVPPPVKEESPRPVTGMSWAGLVVALLVAEYLFALDTTVVANIRPTIIRDLGHVDKLSWISVAYGLGETSTNPLWGKLYGHYDSKILYCSALLIFNIGSAICGSAPNPNAFIVGNVVAGAGGSGIWLGITNILAALTNTQEKAIYMSYMGLAWCIGTITGPIIGGAFADSSATWRWAFYMNLCISAVLAPIVLFIIPKNPSGVQSKGLQSLRRLDFTGLILFAGGAATLIMATAFGGQIYAWNSGQTIALIVLCVVLWMLFAVQQRFCLLTTPEDRTFPHFSVEKKEMALLFVETAIGISCVVATIYFLPFFYQFVRGSTAVQSGVKTLPFLFVAVFSCLVQGALFPKFNFYLPWFTVGAALTLVGAGLMTTLSPSLSDAHIYGYTVVLGAGAGAFTQVGFPIAQALQPVSGQPAVAALLTMAQTVGVTTTLGIGSSVFLNRATDGISAILPAVPRAQVQDTVTGVAGSQLLRTLDDATRMRVLTVIARSIANVFIMLTVYAGIAVIVSMFLQRRRAFLPGVGSSNSEETSTATTKQDRSDSEEAKLEN